MKRDYNVLIVGAGKIGSIRARVARKLFPGTKLYVYDRNLKRSKALAGETGGVVVKSLSRCLGDKNIDIVVVATVNKFLSKICLLALKNKKHVLCEKPMGVSYKEALGIYKAVKKYKRKFKCGFNHRYHPAIRKAYRLCKQEKIGRILFIRAAYGHGGREGYNKEWRGRRSLSGGGELLDQGSHLIDLCHWFFGFEKIKKTYCMAKTMFWKMDVDDNAFVLLETSSGRVAQIHATWTQWKNTFRFEVYGEKGAIEISGLGGSYGTETLRVFRRLRLGKKPRIIEEQFKGYDNSWELEYLNFVRAINSRKAKPLLMSNHKESLMVMKTISRLYSGSK